MGGCIDEDELLELAHGRRRLGDAPELEAHLADCAACSGLLSTMLAVTSPAEARRDLAGSMLGPYRLDGLIGAGAMGEVYRGWDLRLHRHVAVKVLPRQLADSPDRIRRLEAEARAAAVIAHPNIVTVYDTGTDGEVPYVVTELITGETLRSALERGSIARDTALELGLQLARGLAAAHAHGVVHRDLKPENLIVADGGTLKILDFGLAKVGHVPGADATAPGTLLGTSGYLAPEQARGEPADARSDLFAAGAILYELLSGRRAFGGATFAERLSAVLRDTPPAIDDPAAPIVMRCLEKDPAKRFQSATDLAWVLEARVRGDAPARATPSPARPRAVVSRRTFLLGAAATGVGGALFGRALAPGHRAFHPAYRQLTFRQGRVARARFTRDGGSVLYAALWDDHPATIYTTRLGGGGTRALALPPAHLLAVSSRGELALALDHRFLEGFHQRGQLALAPLEGGEPRVLGVDVQDADFTPDGRHLAIVRRAARFQLECPIGTVLLEAGWLSNPRVSPDGQLIACCVHDWPGDDRGELVVVPRAGGAARTVAAGWSSIDGVTWAPSGRAVWISASREGGNNSVRAIGLDGRERVHVPAAGRLRVHDLARTGELAVTHCSGRVRMMVKAPDAPAEADLALGDVSVVADIAGDGRSIVFVELGDVDTANGAYLRPTDGGPAVRLGAGIPFDLADDERGVLGWLAQPEPAMAVWAVHAGQPRPLAFPTLASVQWARWCAGDRMIVAGAVAGRGVQLWRRDPDGTLVPLTEPGALGPAALGSCAISPDGRALALIADARLLVVDVARGRPPRAVPGSYADEVVCGWYTGGGEVFVRTKAAPLRIRRVDVTTAGSTPVRELHPPPLGLRAVNAVVLSHDGNAYAYSYGQELSRLFSMTTEDPGA